MATLLPEGKQSFISSAGDPLVGGKLYTYDTGTSTPRPTYQDAAGTVPNTNPVIMDARGEATVFWDGSYKVVLKDSSDVVIWTVDGVSDSAVYADTLRAELLSSSGSSKVGFTPGGANAVPTTTQNKMRQFVTVADALPVGYVVDGSVDYTTQIQSALDDSETSGAFLYGVPGIFTLSTMLSIKCNCDLSVMHFEVDATVVTKAIQVGPAASGQYLFDADIKLPKVTNTAKAGIGWVGFDTSTGIEIANVYQSRITVPYIYNFGIGLREGGYGAGCVYNTITVGVLFGNKVNQLLMPGDTNGWSNQNTHIGGRWAHSSAEGSAVAGTAHIKLRDFALGGSNAPNTNVWMNPSIEGNEPEFHVDIQGAYNTIFSPRFELTGGVSAKVNFHAETVNETVANQFFNGYKAGIVYTYSGAGTSGNNGYIGGRGNNTLDFSGGGYNVRNTSGNTVSAPHFQGFPATADALNKDQAATDWTYRIYAEGFSVKATGNTVAKINMDASGYLFFGPGTSALVGGFRYSVSGPAITCNYAFAPDADNTLTLGTATRRWSVVYAGNATINTSDAREKQQVRDLADAERAVAVRCKSLIKAFKFNDAVDAKGNGARVHFGVMAQDIATAFAAEGLDSANYSMFCYDSWGEIPEVLAKDGSVEQEFRPAGDRYGIRYEELLCFVIGAM